MDTSSKTPPPVGTDTVDCQCVYREDGIHFVDCPNYRPIKVEDEDRDTD